MDIAQYAGQGADLRVRWINENEAKLRRAAERIGDAIVAGGKVLAFGNGGSAADAQHLAGEMLGRFKENRKPLACVALTTDSSALTCIANDYSYDDVFARQIQALGRPGDVAWAISTSGNSSNVIKAVEEARIKGMFVIGLTGDDGGKMASVCDLALIIPERSTALIQEMHLTVLHIVSTLLDERFTE